MIFLSSITFKYTSEKTGRKITFNGKLISYYICVFTNGCTCSTDKVISFRVVSLIFVMTND